MPEQHLIGKDAVAPMGWRAGPRHNADEEGSSCGRSRERRGSRSLLFTAIVALILFFAFSKRERFCGQPRSNDWHRHVKNAADSSYPPLEVFQVYQPVLAPIGASDVPTLTNGSSTRGVSEQTETISERVCSQVLMQYSFANSYGKPFIASYTPPSCAFNRVTINFTVTSQGRQFDRLGLMYFGDIEVFRTSTAEPTANGIQWSYIKDMSNYLSLFKTPQKLIFDLGNLVDSTYTAPFDTKLTATFFNVADSIVPADEILPISARRSSSNASSAFTVPSDNATNTVSFPRNVRRAVFTISACGQASEEFWWSNVLSSNTDAFASTSGTLYGFSPFRELQLLIDGNLVGVAWPFAIIFTGGVAPGFWRPIVGIDAFDLREREIDITPWLPLLCDGNEHTFEMRVVGLSDNGKGDGVLSNTVGDNWVVTGKVFIWLDKAGSITTGTRPVSMVRPPTLSVSSAVTANATGANETLSYQVRANRQLSVNSTIHLSNGSYESSWGQTLEYTNNGLFTDQGYSQVTTQTTRGFDQSSGGYSTSYFFPLSANTTYTIDAASGNFSIDAMIDRGLNLQVGGDAVFPTGLESFVALPNVAQADSTFTGTALHTTQNGSAHYRSVPSSMSSFSFGTTEQEFFFGGLHAPSMQTIGSSPLPGSFELYRRHVLATNGTVIEDDESLIGESLRAYTFPTPLVGNGDVLNHGFADFRVKDVLGRGPPK
ncbi:MAG: hypothetical protein M4579_001720 [Chaenotheca gracillima]|nr:MAG: hypothetical protein M4579_001720 [Chaenotheca gracillima]